MRFKKLHLENFRCFQEIDIDFHLNQIELDSMDKNLGGLTVLIAQNAEGKTAILDAINIALGPFLTKLTKLPDKYPITYEDNYRLADGSISGYAKIDATLLNPENFVREKKYKDFHVIRYFDGLYKSTKTEDHYHLTNLAKHIFNWENGGDPWPLIAYYGDQRLWESLSSRYTVVPMLSQDRLAGYQDARKPATGYKRCLQWMKELSLTLFGEQKKKEDKDLSYNQDTIDRLQCFMGHMKMALREIMAPSGYTEFNFNVSKNELEVWGKKHPVRIEASRLSAGIRIVVGMVSDMVFRCCMLNPLLEDKILEKTPCIVLIDEIELHLHPAWQQNILPVLQKIFPNIQFIVTTHSPQVISSVPRECVRIISSGKIVNPCIATDGARADQILEEVFCVNARFIGSPVYKDLIEFQKLLNEDQWDTEQGKELYKKLRQNLPSDPILAEFDMMIHLKEYERRNHEEND